MSGDGQEGSLDALLAAMPRIAEAVKAFPEAVQPQAFEMLMAEARGEAPTTTRKQERKTISKRRTRPKSQAEEGEPKRRRTSGSPSTIRDLDLTPKGKKSLKDFVAEKQPKTNHDQNAVSVYYLKEELGEAAVTIDHVFTCYKDMHWREPYDMANSLSLTSSRKRFLDTSDLEDITLTPAGRNHVEQDLPPKKKAK